MANAGRVAIVPKGDYSSSVTYKRLDLVRYNDKAYVAKKASTGVLPTNTDYWMLMTSDGIVIDNALSDTSTNPVQNKAVKTAIDSIQTTSRATLSQAGWYRVAEINGYDTVQKCTLKILRPYDNSQAEIHTLNYEKAQNDKGTNIDIKSSGSKAGTHLFTKARITKDSSKTYFEVYYSSSIRNLNCCFTAIDGGYINTWQAITPTLTSETVDGVTVTTTYDIPANASPVTDLDIADLVSETDLTTALDKCMRDGNDYGNTVFNSYNLDDWVKSGCYASRIEFTNYPQGSSGYGDVLIIAGYPDVRVTQIFRDWNDNKLYFRALNRSTWETWQTLATTADLANYVKNTGGDIDGQVQIVSGTAKDRLLRIKNSVRSIMQAVYADGTFRFRDETNGNNIIISTADGANTFNGTASGNLPLTGGTIDSTQTTPVEINSKSSQTTVLMRFCKNGVKQGYYGFNGVDSPIFLTGDGSAYYDIHHDGNSAKVAVSATAPSDTSSVWVDSKNKATKVYIDGAWTALA